MILIKNANLISMAKINYEVTDILVVEGKIKKVGKLATKDYPKAEVIDAKENFVTPGLVDPHCHIGLFEEAIRAEGADGNEVTDPVTPHQLLLDAIKPQDIAFKEALASGVTTVCTGRGVLILLVEYFQLLKLKVKRLMIWSSLPNHR